QYRSAIFYQNEDQKKIAAHYKQELNDKKVFDNSIVTEISPLKNFYAAEDYHQNYFNNNGDQPYCYFVIRPTLEKFEKFFKNQLKVTNHVPTLFSRPGFFDFSLFFLFALRKLPSNCKIT